MTGTAKTEADEFFDIYKLGNQIPTNKNMVRVIMKMKFTEL